MTQWLRQWILGLAGLRAAGLEPVEIKEKRGWVCVICKNAAEV